MCITHDIIKIHCQISYKGLKVIKDNVKRTVILTREIFGCITFSLFSSAAQVLGPFLSKLLSSDLKGPYPAFSRSHFLTQCTSSSLLSPLFNLLPSSLLFFKKYVFVWLLWVLVAARGSFLAPLQHMDCGAGAPEQLNFHSCAVLAQ